MPMKRKPPGFFIAGSDTGVGKTYLIRSAADLIGVPFVKADATKFSETGYVGGDVEDMVRDLVRLTVLREGRRVELQGAFPAWHTRDTAVP